MKRGSEAWNFNARAPQKREIIPQMGGVEWVSVHAAGQALEHIAGMEVYTRPAQLPARFNTPGSACGDIVVWTR